MNNRQSFTNIPGFLDYEYDDESDLSQILLGFFEELLEIHHSEKFPDSLCQPFQQFLLRERAVEIRLIHGKKVVKLSKDTIQLLREHDLLE
jgi:hypothetical protein